MFVCLVVWHILLWKSWFYCPGRFCSLLKCHTSQTFTIKPQIRKPNEMVSLSIQFFFHFCNSNIRFLTNNRSNGKNHNRTAEQTSPKSLLLNRLSLNPSNLQNIVKNIISKIKSQKKRRMDPNAKTIFFLAMFFIYLSFPNISLAHTEVGMITISISFK